MKKNPEAILDETPEGISEIIAEEIVKGSPSKIPKRMFNKFF